ncbi:MAG: hypothetical protein LGR52_10755 [Candidatus Thiosymbion ectosymbiont of Robbea hypermnestra]|nr:hypothetical protein [Candidatus Thiosymbion ectosymbiont of Robbea hypermnestra]
MFERIISALKEQPSNVREGYHAHLEDMVSSARNIGWGYYDYIRELLDEYQSELEDT